MAAGRSGLLLGMSLVQYLPPIFFGLLSVAFLAIAYGFNPASGAMPILIGWTMVVLTLVDLITRMRVGLGDLLVRALNPAALRTHHEVAIQWQIRRQAVACLVLTVVVALMMVFGILPVVPVFLLVALRGGAGRGWGGSAAGAVGMTVLVWLLFSRLLGLQIFPGLLFGGEW